MCNLPSLMLGPWGRDPFDMIDAAQQLEELSYGFLDPTLLDTAGAGLQKNFDDIWWLFYYTDEHCCFTNYPMPTSPAVWGLYHNTVQQPWAVPPCQRCGGGASKPSQTKFKHVWLLLAMLSPYYFKHLALCIIHHYSMLWGAKPPSIGTRTTIQWWSQKVQTGT